MNNIIYIQCSSVLNIGIEKNCKIHVNILCQGGAGEIVNILKLEGKRGK